MTGRLRGIGRGIWRRVTRKKHVDVDDVKTELRRCISTKRLTLIGVGKTVGVGIYVLIGVATKEYAGPAVILSFLVAFLVTLLNSLCFAEYASKNPKTGAQYTYMYEAVGEGVAFIVGWTSIIGFTAAMSLAARGWSGYLDSLFNHAIQNFTISHVGHWSNGPPLSEYPDFPAIFIVLVVMVVTSVGVNFSSKVNSTLAAVSGSVLVFIIITGLFYADFKNWFNHEGGFFPYGIKGIIKGSSACFYAFQGFDIIGLSAEETENPKKAVPRAIICELLIVTMLYLAVAISFTLMIPYTQVNTNAPFPGAFAYHSVTWAKYIVAIGPLIALSNLCTLEMYAITRVAYSMSSDGLLFSVFSKVNKRTNVPVISILIVGPVVIGIVLGLDLKNVVSFMIMYVFLQYSFFASYLLILRYDPSSCVENDDTNIADRLHNLHTETDTDMIMNGLCNEDNNQNETITAHNFVAFGHHNDEEEIYLLESEHNTSQEEINLLEEGCENNIANQRGFDDKPEPDAKFKRLNEFMTVTKFAICIYISSFLLAVLVINGSSDLLRGNPTSVYSALTLSVVILLATLCVYCKEQRGDKRGYMVPLMPFFPVLCIVCNMLMLVSVAETGSIIAAVSLAAIGAAIYLLIVITDVLRDPGQSVSRDLTSREQAGLLKEVDAHDWDFEQETTNEHN